MRDTMIFYRSFYEAIKELTLEEQGKIYSATFEYGLNFNEVELTGISKTVFTLIKPQLDANIKRFNNGNIPKAQKEEAKHKQNRSKKKAKVKQEISETEANNNNNNNINNNDNENNKEEEPPHPLQKYVNEKFKRITKLPEQLTKEECEKLLLKYKNSEISKVLMAMENHKDIHKKISVYLTLLNWLERDKKEETPKQYQLNGKQ
jgi:hypothetical protein